MLGRRTVSVILMSLLSMTSTGLSRESFREQFFGVCVPDCIQHHCCDDYCAKPAPPMRCLCRGGCNDYCSKPLPCVKFARHYCSDDYCPKCPPCPTCPRR